MPNDVTQQSDPILDQILSSGPVTVARDTFALHDKAASEAQAAFRLWTRLFIFASALATLTAACILYGSGVEAGGGDTEAQPANADLAALFAEPAVRIGLFVLQIAGLALAAFSAQLLDAKRFAAVYPARRREAEADRIAIFEAAIAVAKPKGAAHLAAVLDYFEREQLEGQIAYYTKAYERHAKGDSWLAILAAIGVAVLATTTAAGSLGAEFGAVWLLFVGLVTVVAPIFFTAYKSWRESTLHSEKAERYEAAKIALIRLRGELQPVRDAVSAGDPGAGDALEAFAERVHTVMRDEQQAWIPARREE